MIPFKRVNLGKSMTLLKPYIGSGRIGLGDAVFKFEEELAKYVGAPYVVVVNSCTAALFLSLMWERDHGVKAVSIPSMTVPHTANAVLQAGLKLVLNPDTSWVGSHYSILGSTVIDSAHEVDRDSYIPGKKICYSFYPTKTIGSADGGAIATDNKDFADWLRSVSFYGRDQKASVSSSWNYDVKILGYKCNWNNLQAVIALEQLRRLDETKKKVQRIVKTYNEAFGYKNSSDYLYRINVNNRDEFLKYMMDHGVECGVHFKPLHLMTPFKDLGILDTPHAKELVESAYKTTVSLPLYDTLTKTEIKQIIALVKTWEKTNEKILQ